MHRRSQLMSLSFGGLVMLTAVFLTLIQDVSWITQRAILMAVTIQPADVQPWMSLVNTALITIGSSLIVLRQKWLKGVTDEQHDSQLAENRDLRTRIDVLTARIDVMRAQSCAAISCPQRTALPPDKTDKNPATDEGHGNSAHPEM